MLGTCKHDFVCLYVCVRVCVCVYVCLFVSVTVCSQYALVLVNFVIEWVYSALFPGSSQAETLCIKVTDLVVTV